MNNLKSNKTVFTQVQEMKLAGAKRISSQQVIATMSNEILKSVAFSAENYEIELAALAVTLASDTITAGLIEESLKTTFRFNRKIKIPPTEMVIDWLIAQNVIAPDMVMSQYRKSNGSLGIGRCYEVTSSLRSIFIDTETSLKETAWKALPCSTVDAVKAVRGYDAITESQENEQVKKAIQKLEMIGLMIPESARPELKRAALKPAFNSEEKDLKAQLVYALSHTGSVFYLPHKADFRGRIYGKTWLAASQNRIYRKMLKFADGEQIHWVDCTCSAAQHIALLFRDRSTAQAVNIERTPNLIKRDLYQEIGKACNHDRDTTKGIVMPYLYGANLDKLAREKELPTEVVETIVNTMVKMFPSLGLYLDWLRIETTQPREEYKWTIDHWTTTQNYKAKTTATAGNWSLLIDSTNDLERQARALPPNIIHSLDAAVMRRVIDSCNFEVISIHDAFGCRERDIPKLVTNIMKAYRGLYASFDIQDIALMLGFDPPELVNPDWTPEFNCIDLVKSE